MVEQLFWVNHSLVWVFAEEGKFDDAQIHVERARSYAVDNTYLLARVSLLQARVRYAQSAFGEAKSEGLRALDVFGKLGAANDAESTRQFLQKIDAQPVGEPEA